MLKQLLLICIFVCSCGSAQRPSTQLDAGPPPIINIDRDAYSVAEAPLQLGDVRLNLTAPDGSSAYIYGINRNTVAPFDGVLFSLPAVAMLEVQFTAQQSLYQLEARRELQLMAARAIRDLEHANVTLEARERYYRIINQSYQDEINQLNQIVQRRNSFLTGLAWFGGGFFVGAAVLGAVLLLAQ